jgi:hypothetical protein
MRGRWKPCNRRYLGRALTEMKATPEQGSQANPATATVGTPRPDSEQHGQQPAAGGQAAGKRPAAIRALAIRVGAQLRPSSLWREHRVFTIAFSLALLPRILEMIAFRPALLTADSFVYMQEAITHKLGTIRPYGYPFFLAIFAHLPHVLTVIVTLQHLMGLGIAVIVYALLRYWGLPGWGATLAALPTLLDTRAIALESYLLPDTLFTLVLMVIVALLITRRTPVMWQCVAAALLLAYASVLRGNGIVLVVVVAAFLVIRKVGWRALTASAAALVVPLLGYAAVYHSQHGEFGLTSSDGIFLWSRTTSFANCAIIKPPAELRPLCPNAARPTSVPPNSPAFSISNELVQNTPSDYLWASDAWWRTAAKPGFTGHNNSLAMSFALRAIESQPLSYLRVAGRDVLLTFIATDRPQDQADMYLTPSPRIPRLPSYYASYEHAYAGTTENTHAVYPFANLMFDYQQPVYFPGVLFLAVVLVGLAGVLRDWRRWGGIQLLPWGLAAVSLLSPALLTQSLYRYAITAIPLACLAAGLSFMRLRGRAASTGGQPASGLPGDTGPAILP